MYSGNFSLWCDFLERDFIDGEFRELINDGVFNGATSNPAIFKNAILNSPAYKESKDKFSKKSSKELYEILATQDIRVAADIMLKNYVDGDDGFVSLEVDPNLSDNSEATFKEGKRLYSTIGMPNVMIKVPATKRGYEAMSELIKKGINVNATLIFSPDQTAECLEAFKEGTKAFKKRFVKANLPKAVISIFVSRFDRMLDEKMKKNGLEAGKIGILNATKCYHMIQEANLENTRALFASTGVKGDEFKKSYYVDELMFKNCINTAPLDTIKEFIKGEKVLKEPTSLKEIDAFFKSVKDTKIDLKGAYKELLDDGLKQFVVAFDDILKALK
ncbi:transaldolase [Campylobacter geochelonis]|uniref:Transaldolase n=1 Tax=Campylobacter geochelonis TaxID=1780362 RepID=A0A128EE68_9BACT|nr:transaldolase [Campylobacter geochelonis]QKF70621.1 transaldolase [Campylobacter geochelonis]CZE45914.1 transaldolase [Campylobacter geochelonis]CZE46722.1 transaldolase [Campylobacter geochelonis]CZE50336.1 transaldolase [Campylobacter geochelonis]